MVCSSMATRLDWWVLVSYSRTSPATWEMDRRMTTSARSRSTSVHRSAHASPRRHPVETSTHRYAAKSGSSASATSSSS